jgi:hypothetical protein
MLYIKDNKIICKNISNTRRYDLTVNKSYNIVFTDEFDNIAILDDDCYPAHFNKIVVLENFYTTDEIRLLKLNSL